MEKRNSVEAGRTPCAVCSEESTEINAYGVPVCDAHKLAPIEKQAVQHFVEKQEA